MQRNKKGITLTSVVMYVVVMLVIVGVIGTINGFFYTSTQNLEESASSLGALNKFNTYFLDEIKLAGNEVKSITDTEIVFSTGTRFSFIEGGIYKDKVKICSRSKSM